jgi:hypothetical protein
MSAKNESGVGQQGLEFFQRMIEESGGESSYARDTIVAFARSALNEEPIEGSNRKILELWIREFILECSDPRGPWREAYKAIDLAFRIGVFVGPTRTIKGWKRERTAGANEQNRNDSAAVQKIIDEEAVSYWKNSGPKKPALTARMIARKVGARIAELDPVPATWKETLKDEGKLRDAIRKRLRCG